MIPLVLTALGLAAASDGGGGDDGREDPRDLQLQFMKKQWPKLFAERPHTVLWTRMDNAPLEAEMMWLLGEWPDPRSVVVVFEGKRKFSVKEALTNEWKQKEVPAFSSVPPSALRWLKPQVVSGEDGRIWNIAHTTGSNEFVRDRLRETVESMGIVFAEMEPGVPTFADTNFDFPGSVDGWSGVHDNPETNRTQFRGKGTGGEWVDPYVFIEDEAKMYGVFLDMGYNLAFVFDDFGLGSLDTGFLPYVIHPLPPDDPHQMHNAKSRDKLARKTKYMWPRHEEKVVDS